MQPHRSVSQAVFGMILTLVLSTSLAQASPVQAAANQRKQVTASNRGLTFTVIGGGSLGSHEGGESRVSPFGGGLIGFEFKLGQRPMTLAPELLLANSFLEEDKTFTQLLAGPRFTYYIEPIGPGGIGIWTGLHLGFGMHDDDTQGHGTFRFSAGLDYMVMPYIGLGPFVSYTIQMAGDGLSPYLNGGQREGGFSDLNFGLRLQIKIPI